MMASSFIRLAHTENTSASSPNPKRKMTVYTNNSLGSNAGGADAVREPLGDDPQEKHPNGDSQQAKLEV